MPECYETFFLTRRSRYDDDVLARDFGVKDESKYPYMRDTRERLNKAFAHLSSKRIGYDQDKGWNCDKMFVELETMIQHFLAGLSNDHRTWFADLEPQGKSN